MIFFSSNKSIHVFLHHQFRFQFWVSFWECSKIKWICRTQWCHFTFHSHSCYSLLLSWMNQITITTIPSITLLINTTAIDSKQQCQTGRQAQWSNITATHAVSDIIGTILRPKSMLKMLLDPMGRIVITTDGNCILREVDISHPFTKFMLELSHA